DGYLRLLTPVAAHRLDLRLHEDGRADERQRDEGHQDHRDDHGDVAAEADQGLADDESEVHEVGPTSSSSSRETPSRSAMPSSATSTSGITIGVVRGPAAVARSSGGVATAGGHGAPCALGPAAS